MKKSYFFLAIFSLLGALTTIAQTYRVTGTTIDSENELPLPGSHVALLSRNDSMVVTTDKQGIFRFPQVKPGRYLLKITFLGYDALRQRVEVNDSDVILGLLRLEQGAQNLDEVTVKEKMVRAVQEGDTTSFNAGAYKTNPDASADDLIKKMPGVINNNGKLEAQGEEVKKVLVDGREFFGNDPNAALKNLPADVIEKIQIFDKQSEQAEFTGFKDGETQKTINIITKTGTSNSQFGKLFAGGGDQGKYQAGGNVNFFNGDQRISLIGQTNNINIQNFATEDLLGVLGSSNSRRFRGSRGGGSRGGGRSRGGGGDASDFLVSQQGGITQTHAFGINYSDKWGENLEITGSYFFNMSDNVSDEFLNRNYIGTGEQKDQLYIEDSRSNGENTNHRANFRIEYKLDDRNSFIIRPRFTYQGNDGIENILASTSEQNELVNATDYGLTARLKGIDASTSILWRHRFKKMGRTVSLSLNGGYKDQSGDNLLFSINEYYTRMATVDSLDQSSDLLSDGWNTSANLAYTEPVGKSGQFQLDYQLSRNDDKSDKKTYDFEEFTQGYTGLAPSLSNVLESQYTTHRAGASYRLRKGASFASISLRAQTSTLKGDQEFPVSDQFTRTFNNILPNAFFRYSVNRSKYLMFGYRTFTRQPSINQLQTVIDNSNPLQIRTGNPDLQQYYQHMVFMRFSNTNTEKASVFYVYLNGSFSDNYIVNSTITAQNDIPLSEDFILNRGSQLIKPVNLSGYYSLRSFVTYGVPFSLIKSNFNINTGFSITRQPGLINELENFANNSRYNLGLVISSNISENVDFTLSSQSNYNIVKNTVNTQLDDNFYNHTGQATLTCILGKRIVFRTDASNLLYSGLGEEFNQNYWLWNASLGVKVFKDNMGEIKLSAFDILKQNQSISRNVTEYYYEDVQSTVLQRFLMLSFSYKIKHFGTAPAPRTQSGEGRFPMGPPRRN